MYLVSLSLDIYIAGHGFMYLLLPLFVCLMKTKNPDFVSKSGFCLLRVVPPGIEPGTQGFSVLCSSSASESSLTLTFGCNQLSYVTL